jgi:hypothetical protein
MHTSVFFLCLENGSAYRPVVSAFERAMWEKYADAKIVRFANVYGISENPN